MQESDETQLGQVKQTLTGMQSSGFLSFLASCLYNWNRQEYHLVIN